MFPFKFSPFLTNPLDLCGGKGGDLFKWEKAGASCVFLVDGAEGSVRDAQQRYQQLLNKNSGFKVLFAVADCFVVRLHDALLPKDLTFDVVSCQFAAHYAWSTEAKAKRFFENCADRLCPNGFFVGTLPNKNELAIRLSAAAAADNGRKSFGNSLYSVTFSNDSLESEFGCSYSFSLKDAVEDCEEYVVSKESFVKMAAGVGLELVEWLSFEEFENTFSKVPPFSTLFEERVSRKVKVSEEEREVVTLYSAFVFQKRV